MPLLDISERAFQKQLRAMGLDFDVCVESGWLSEWIVEWCCICFIKQVNNLEPGPSYLVDLRGLL